MATLAMSVPETAKKRARILLVSPEENFRKTLCRILDRCGYRVEVADSGEEALGRLGGERFDGVVSQIQLAGAVCGVTLLSRLREKGLDVPVLLLTESETQRIRDALEANPGAACISRHADLDFLKSALAACVFPHRPARHL
jgi:CheY-like chemotaxis protein